MKSIHPSIITASIAIVLAALSCRQTPPAANIECSTCEYCDSTGNALLSISLEFPTAPETSASVIRDSLMTVFFNQLEVFGSEEDDRITLKPYDGPADDLQKLVAHYGKDFHDYIDSLATEDINGRIEDSGFPSPWEYEACTEKIAETDRYVVFNCTNYIYMGGAHGGVYGYGALTFRKSDGKLIEDVIDRSRLADMQDMLKKYIDDSVETLFIEGDTYPLPSWEPSLSEEGVVFVYQQYEIAPYSEGMPSFTVPYSEISKYLTPEAKSLVR